MPREYAFDERMQMSQGISATRDIKTILMANIPGTRRVETANQDDDRHGTDYWVYHERGEPYSVDIKVRDEDWAFKPGRNAADDLALETWSVIEKQVIGWTRNQSKMTDYVLWFWRDSGRWCLVPFAMLCAVMQENWESWRRQFKTCRQHTPREFNNGYHSECVFVPRREVWATIYKRFGGSVMR
jgi:hypothetical protein